MTCCHVKPIVIDYGGAKNWISDELHISHAVLHIHLGLTIFLASSLLLRRRIGTWPPLLIVLALETANELFDFARYKVSDWPWKPTGTIEDVVNTMLWPVILTLLFRWAALRPRSKSQVGGDAGG